MHRAFASLFFSLTLLTPAAISAASCESLANLKLPDTQIEIAQDVPAGNFAPPYGPPLAALPAFCRVAGRIHPSADSDIAFEVWLPAASSWNSKFLGVGNGGFAGAISYSSLANNLKRDYATAATDTGHEGQGTDATWAYHHPEKVTDFGYRGLHLTAVQAKAIVAAFYGQPSRRNYFDACSDGGREALMEAQRFPEDFDGILAGAPANNWTRMMTAAADGAKALAYNPVAYFSDLKIPAIHAAAVAACDAKDGVKDGVINDPTACHFDPSVLLCRSRETRACLTAPQLAVLNKFYQGGRDSHGAEIFPGLVPGAEDGPGGWGPWVVGPSPAQSAMTAYSENFFRYMIFEDPAWVAAGVNVDLALRTAGQKSAHDLDAVDPDLSRFAARGGKLILYHGWNDPAISPYNSIAYYRSVTAAMGAEKTASFSRLYLVPGMQHCLGGPGASFFGQLGAPAAPDAQGIYAALENWVEQGTAPAVIIAAKPATDPAKPPQMTRPLCPFPEIAKYKGSGDTNDQANFACAASGAESAGASARSR